MKEKGDSRYIHQKELDKACFVYDMTSGDFSDLNRRAFAYKVLQDKPLSIAKDPEYDGYQRRLASMVYKYFNTKTSGSGIESENIPYKDLVEELHKPITRKFNERKVQWPFIGNIWSADLADKQLICKFNKGFRFLNCY